MTNLLKMEEMNCMTHIKRFAFALALMSCCVTVSFAQQGAERPPRSLTSEDLLNRPTLYIPAPTTPDSRLQTSDSHSSRAARTIGGVYYRDPSGAFTLNFPSSNWHISARAASAGRAYHERAFRRVEDEGYASATANVYVITAEDNLPLVDPARLNADEQRAFGEALATRFLSSNVEVIAIAPIAANTQMGLRIIADQTIARRAVVRASINVFAHGGKLYVVVCSASPETFETDASEFDTITNSLASSVARS
jgi:hypothetical protein